MCKFNRSAAPFRNIFFPRVRFYCLFAATSVCAMQSATLKKCTHTIFVATSEHRRKEVTLRSTYLCLFRRGVPRATYGIETVPALFGGKRVMCPKVVERKFVAHVVTCRKTFGEDRGKEPFGTFSLVYRQFVFILTSIQQPSVGRLVR